MNEINKLVKEIKEKYQNKQGIESQKHYIELLEMFKEKIEAEKDNYLKLSVYFENQENYKIVGERIEKVGGFLIPYVGYTFCNMGIPIEQIERTAEMNLSFFKEEKNLRYVLIKLENGDIFRHVESSGGEKTNPKIKFSPLDPDSEVFESNHWQEYSGDFDLLKETSSKIQKLQEEIKNKDKTEEIIEKRKDKDKAEDIIKLLKKLFYIANWGNYGIALKEVENRNEVLSLRIQKEEYYFYCKSYSPKRRLIEEERDWKKIFDEEEIEEHLKSILNKCGKLTLEVLIPLEVETTVL